MPLKLDPQFKIKITSFLTESKIDYNSDVLRHGPGYESLVFNDNSPYESRQTIVSVRPVVVRKPTIFETVYNLQVINCNDGVSQFATEYNVNTGDRNDVIIPCTEDVLNSIKGAIDTYIRKNPKTQMASTAARHLASIERTLDNLLS